VNHSCLAGNDVGATSYLMTAPNIFAAPAAPLTLDFVSNDHMIDCTSAASSSYLKPEYSLPTFSFSAPSSLSQCAFALTLPWLCLLYELLLVDLVRLIDRFYRKNASFFAEVVTRLI